jgi:hypothetical protein
MSYSFATIQDTPDITIPKGKRIYLTYEYKWGSTRREISVEKKIPLQIHLKDLLKIEQLGLYNAYRSRQVELGGEPPMLENIQVVEIPADWDSTTA